jgi:hypothetical protein
MMLNMGEFIFLGTPAWSERVKIRSNAIVQAAVRDALRRISAPRRLHVRPRLCRLTVTIALSGLGSRQGLISETFASLFCKANTTQYIALAAIVNYIVSGY